MSETTDQPARRPLKSRSTWWAAWLSTRLVRMNISPNAISLLSIVSAGIAAGAFVATRSIERPIGNAALFLVAAAGIQGRLLCNLMDGMVAVEGGKRTPAGELFNEVPDRIGDTLILVAAGYAGDPTYGPTLGWLAALLAMFTAYIRAVGKAAGAGTYFLGPMAKPHRMACMTVGCVGAASGIVLHTPISSGETISLCLFVVCLGCIPTCWRRLSRIVADLRSNPPVA